MYHSIKIYRTEDVLGTPDSNFFKDFYVKDTYDSWGLIPTQRPSVPPPAVKTKYVDIPGADSKLDFTSSLVGYPLLDNRTGSWNFMIDREFVDKNWPDQNIEKTWQDLYSEIMDWLQGNNLCAVLEDDQSWYYVGRFWVSALNSEQKYTTITINYDVKPYKRAMFIDNSNGNWLWDGFDFLGGVIPDGVITEIEVNSPNDYTQIIFPTRNVTEWYSLFGREPVLPKVEISDSVNGLYLHFQNNSLHRKVYETPNDAPLTNGIYTYKELSRNVIIGGECLEMYTDSSDYINGHHIGDVDLSGVFSAADSAYILKIYANLMANITDISSDAYDFLDLQVPEPSIDTRTLQMALADFDRDGKITAADASNFLKFYADITAKNKVVPITQGTLYGNSTLDVRVKGVGKISFIFRPGRL